jgi:hypothetical protein
MRHITELVSLGSKVGHLFDLRNLDLLGDATLATDDVMVMILIHATVTKEFLTLRRDDGVKVTFFDQDLELAIDGGKAE